MWPCRTCKAAWATDAQHRQIFRDVINGGGQREHHAAGGDGRLHQRVSAYGAALRSPYPGAAVAALLARLAKPAIRGRGGVGAASDPRAGTTAAILDDDLARRRGVRGGKIFRGGCGIVVGG